MAYITRVHIDRCRNVQDLDIDLSVPSAEDAAEGPASSERSVAPFRHLILTGPNGSGKSGVLEAISYYAVSLLMPRERAVPPELVGSISNVDEEAPTSSSILPALSWNVSRNELATMFSRGDIVSVYLSARRKKERQDVSGPTKLDLGVPGQLDPRREVSGKFLQFLVNKRTELAFAAEDGDTATVEHINAWFKTLEHRFRSLMEDEGLTLEYDRSAFNFSFRKSDGYVFDLNTLADGHATVMAILAELLLRVDAARRARKDMSFDPEGIVIIDEIETHLHLSLQEQILPLLTDMFPRFQFIVATHSPAVIASIPGAVVYDFARKSQAPSEVYRGVPYGALMTGHFGISSDIDLDSTEKLLRLRVLAALAVLTSDEEQELQALAATLSARSQVLAVEVWMARERLGESNVRLAGDNR